MPKKRAIERAKRDKAEGKAPSTQAGEFVREEIRKYEAGDSDIQSRKQAIAIGLSEARRAGVALEPPEEGEASEATVRKAERDLEEGEKGPLKAA